MKEIVSKFVFVILLMFSYNILANQNINIKMLQERARDGDSNAQVTLGYYYYSGQYVKANPQKAFELFKEAAKSGNKAAYGNLGVFYQLGLNNVKPDYKKALQYFTLAANNGYPVFWSYIGIMYQKGQGVEKDINKAFKYELMSANANVAIGQFNLANLYASLKQFDKAYYWYLRSANNDFIKSIRKLAFYYEFGVGTDKNYAKAYKWFSIGKNKGDKISTNELAYLTKKMTPEEIQQGKALLQNNTTDLGVLEQADANHNAIQNAIDRLN